ncbi:MAG TPA: NUDIX hydrolase [Acidimicrobiales bacterium]|nr:NUDIX hydrolase [Acidimicrobiales bacterium]
MTGAIEPEPTFRHVGDQLIHRGFIVSTVKATFTDPNGDRFERDVVRHPGAVAVVPMPDAASVLLVRQFRPAVDRWLFEVPAGTRDVDGEPLETTAHRELAEELGRAAGRLQLLTHCLNTPGFCDEVTTVFLATDLHPVPTNRQGLEEGFMSIEEMTLTRFDDLVDDGTIVDAVTILGVALARRRRQGSDRAG